VSPNAEPDRRRSRGIIRDGAVDSGDRRGHPARVSETTAPVIESETIAAALRAARRRLAAVSETPGLDAEVLLRHVLGLDRAALFARTAEGLAPGDRAAFTTLVAARARGTPVAYLVGEREFMGLPFLVRPGVLVPRPETEGLVEWALTWLVSRAGAGGAVAGGAARPDRCV
jgi:hypothetical protein